MNVRTNVCMYINDILYLTIYCFDTCDHLNRGYSYFRSFFTLVFFCFCLFVCFVFVFFYVGGCSFVCGFICSFFKVKVKVCFV